MAAEITLFGGAPVQNGSVLQIARTPIQGNITTTFTPTQDAVARVYANGTAVVLTIRGISFTIPNGSVEYVGVTAGQQVTVA